MFAKVNGNMVTEWPIPSIASRFPDISFSTDLSNASLPEGYVFVGVIAPPTAPAGKKVVPGMPVQQNGTWVQSWDIIDMTALELQELADAQAASVREKRDLLLQQSDLNVLRCYEQGIPVPAELVQYRQALRDIPLQEGFPHTVVWPTRPQ